VAWAALGALIALALWTGLSASWSSAPDMGVLDFERTAGYVAAFGVGLLVCAGPQQSGWLVGSVMLALAVVVAAAAASRLLPGIVEGNADTDAIGMYRLGWPLSYWNAVGAVSAMCAVLAVGHAASRRSSSLVRAGSAALAVLAVVTLALTLSRASWVAFAAGIAVLLFVSVQRARLVATLLVAGAAAAPVVAVVLATDALVVDPTAGSGQREAGAATALLLLAAMAGAALGTTVIQAVSRTLVHIPQRTLVRTGIVLAGLVLVIGALGYGVAGDRIEGETASGFDRVERFFERQWDEFNTAAAVPAAGPERLTSAGGTRSRVFSVAVDGWLAAPLAGEGAGSFSVRWARERTVAEELRDAHSLPLETLAELGLVGFVFLMVFVGSVGVGVLQRRRSRGRTLPRAVNAAVAGALAVWCVHASVDWDWEMPAVTLPALFLAGAVFPAVRRERRGGRSTQAAQLPGRGEAGPVRPAPGV
jgi:O-antigen ligase